VRRAGLLLGLALAVTFPANATPLECASPCTITALAFGYNAPVTEIQAGAWVHWITFDTSHPTTDTVDFRIACFSVPAGLNVAPKPVRFDITPAGITATTRVDPGDPTKDVTRSCSTGTMLPTGTWVQPYQCLLHPWMRAALLIRPGSAIS
jgi:hypothetical protein